MNDCVRYRFCYGTFGIIRQFFSMITLFPPFLPGIVPHKRYGILQLADYEPSGTTSSIASPKSRWVYPNRSIEYRICVTVVLEIH